MAIRIAFIFLFVLVFSNFLKAQNIDYGINLGIPYASYRYESSSGQYYVADYKRLPGLTAGLFVNIAPSRDQIPNRWTIKPALNIQLSITKYYLNIEPKNPINGVVFIKDRLYRLEFPVCPAVLINNRLEIALGPTLNANIYAEVELQYKNGSYYHKINDEFKRYGYGFLFATSYYLDNMALYLQFEGTASEFKNSLNNKLVYMQMDMIRLGVHINLNNRNYEKNRGSLFKDNRFQ